MAVVRVLKVFEDGLHQFKVDSSCPSFGGMRHVQRSLNRGMKMRQFATNLLSDLVSVDVIFQHSNLKKLVFMLAKHILSHLRHAKTCLQWKAVVR